jgi:hypothetical protein
VHVRACRLHERFESRVALDDHPGRSKHALERGAEGCVVVEQEHPDHSIDDTCVATRAANI